MKKNKSKKDYKKEARKYVKKVAKKNKKCIFKTLLVVVTAIAGVLATFKFISNQFNKKNNASKLNIKDIFVSVGAKSYDFVEKITTGAMISAYFGSVNCDFSACEFVDGTFVTIKSFASKVNLIMPENVNVKFDFVNTGSYIKWNVEDEDFDETKPTVYVALKTACSYVTLNKQFQLFVIFYKIIIRQNRKDQR